MKKILLVLMFFANGHSFSQPFTRMDSLRGRLTPLRKCFDVTYYNLSIIIDVENKTIAGSNTIHFRKLTDFSALQLDLFSTMVIDSVLSAGVHLSFSRDSNSFYVDFKNDFVNDTGALQVFYHGKPIQAQNPPWDGGFVWSKTGNGKIWAGVACEGIGASLWWPCKDHPSDEPDSMRMSFQIPTTFVDDGYTVISNGTRTQSMNLANGFSSFDWKVSYPINTYNVTFYIGPYKHRSDRLNSLKIDYYITNTESFFGFDHLKSAKKVIKTFEKLFGPYPFPRDGYALVEAPYLGMEHQGAIAYGDNFTFNTYGFDFIIVHESAHEWWGNSISCADHAELWIHESFATYAEALYVEDQLGYEKMVEYLMEQKGRIKNLEPILGPLGVNFNRWMDTDKYYKGAWMLHTLRSDLDNDSLWFATLKGLAMENQLKIVSSSDMIHYFSTAFGKNLEPFFGQYLTKTTPPTLEYYFRKNENGQWILNYRLKSDFINLQITMKARKNGYMKYSPLAESRWKSMEVKGGKDGFSWAEDLFYVFPKEIIAP